MEEAQRKEIDELISKPGRQPEAYRILKEYQGAKDVWYHRSMFICSFYAGAQADGRFSIDKLMFSNSPCSEEGHRNYNWYVVTLPSQRIEFSYEFKCHLFDVREPGNPVQVIYFPANPSVVRTDEGYLVNVRFVNYLVAEGLYPSTSPNRMVKTINSQLRLDKDFKQISYLDVDDTNREKHICFITGIEDVRLKPGSNHVDGKFIGTVCDYKSDWNNMPRMIIGERTNSKVTSSMIPAVPHLNRCEKNWSFIEDDDRILYGFEMQYNPENPQQLETYVVLVHPESDLFRTTKVKQTTFFNGSFLRGSTPLIKFNHNGHNGYLTVFHHVAVDANIDNPKLRRYYHRLAIFDLNFQVTHMSHAFQIENIRIQYIPGICISHNQKDLIISLSLEDRTAHLRTVPIDFITNSSFMKPIGQMSSLE